MNLYEFNPNLDNTLKRLNRRAISAAKSLGTNSKTLRETNEVMLRISRATGAKVTWKKINNADVLQISRSVQPFISIKQGSMNDIALQSAVMMEKSIKGVQNEVEVHVGRPVSFGEFRNIAKTVKRDLDKQEILADVNSNDFWSVLGRIKNLSEMNILSSLADAIQDGRYYEYYGGVISRVEDSLEEMRAELEELDRERESVRGTEKFADVQNLYSEKWNDVEELSAALNALKERYDELTELRKGRG